MPSCLMHAQLAIISPCYFHIQLHISGANNANDMKISGDGISITAIPFENRKGARAEIILVILGVWGSKQIRIPILQFLME